MVAFGLVATGLSYSGARSQAAPDLSETCDGTDDDGAGLSRTHESDVVFAVLPEVNLPSKVEAHLRVVAEKYHKATGKGLVVTSGTRDAYAQAEVIYEKLAAGDDIVKLYKAKASAQDLKRIYDEGKAAKNDKSAIVEEMASAIRAQIKKGVFISAHLRAGAADVRSTDMSNADKRHFVEASETGGLSVMLESTPPHFHLQLE
jgi:hypothetical protein